MKKITIVDEHDTVIGSKPREEIMPKDIYRVSALWLTSSKGEFLLAQRSFTKKNNPGRWGPAVAGTVEDGESYEENMTKEIEEELGLKNVVLTPGPKKRITGEHNHFTQWYLLTLDRTLSEFTPSAEEVEKIQWFSEKDFYTTYASNPAMFLPRMKEYVEILHKSL